MANKDYQNFSSGMGINSIRASGLQTHTDAAKRIDNIHAVPPLYVQRRASSITIGMHKEHRRGGGEPGGGIPLVAFVLQEGGIYQEHIRCKRKNGAGEDVAILKEELVRQTIIGSEFQRRNIAVFILPSSGTSNQTVIAQAQVEESLLIETWNVLPSWEPGDTIWAAPIAEGDRVELQSSVSNDVSLPPSGVVTPEWIEVRGRWWAAQRIQDATL